MDNKANKNDNLKYGIINEVGDLSEFIELNDKDNETVKKAEENKNKKF
jgi:hypothetical protein